MLATYPILPVADRVIFRAAADSSSCRRPQHTQPTASAQLQRGLLRLIYAALTSWSLESYLFSVTAKSIPVVTFTMLFTSPASILLSAVLLSTSTTAAPTRTHCRCRVVTDAPPAIYTPSAAHWTPTESIPRPEVADFCANLGPELENFPHAAEAFVSRHSQQRQQFQNNGDDHSALTASVLVNFASQNQALERSRSNSEPRPVSRPNQRIVCHSEVDSYTAYQDSFATLWTLQIIIAVAIFACAAEGIHLGMRWYSQTSGTTKGFFRLSGTERLLLALPPSNTQNEKKAYDASAPTVIVYAPCGKREFIAYGEDCYDDDEVNRPVM